MPGWCFFVFLGILEDTAELRGIPHGSAYNSSLALFRDFQCQKEKKHSQRKYAPIIF